jgi:ATP-dependent helicase HrpB
MVMAAGPARAGLAAELAAVLVERGLGGDGVDLTERVRRFRRDGGQRARDMRRLAAGWARSAGGTDPLLAEDDAVGAQLVLAYPDRVAKARGRPGGYLLANGRGAELEPHEALAREPFIVVADLTGSAASARILAAAAIAEADLRAALGDRITPYDETVFDATAKALRRRAGQRLGAITLSERALPPEPDLASAGALARGAVAQGVERLPWSKAQVSLRGRVNFLRGAGETDWPDLSDHGLSVDGGAWLAPHIIGRGALSAITADDLGQALDALVPWAMRQRLEQEAPAQFVAPTGTHALVDYEAEAGPTVSIRVQELYGLSRHPALAGGRVPLVLELLSPAHRPIQVTRDLPGFWKGSWSSVRSEMKGRYPRHLWPEDPAAAEATTRAKPRGT